MAATTTGSETTSDGSASVTGGPDVPPSNAHCPATVEVELCVPATATEPTFCLCSRQNLGGGIPNVATDLDGDGFDDVVVRGDDDRSVPWLSDGAVLVERPAIDWPADVDAPVVDEVPTLSTAVYLRIADDVLRFGTWDLDAGPSPASMLALPPDLYTAREFGDFDGDGAVDLAIGVVEPGADGDQLRVTVYADALAEPPGLDLVVAPAELAIDTVSVALTTCDFDGDDVDDLWIFAYTDAYPQVVWGNVGGLAVPGDPLPQFRSCFDFGGDGLQDLLAPGPYDLGAFEVYAQPSPRVFEPAATVPPVGIEDFSGNAVEAVHLGDRVVALTLRSDDTIFSDESAIGVTSLDTLDDVSPMRMELVQQVASFWAALDVDGDGREEVLAWAGPTYRERQLYVFDVVEFR